MKDEGLLSFRDECGTVWEWRGREYIHGTAEGATGAHAAINVWDYERDAPRIPFTFEAMVAEIAQACDAASVE